MTHKNVSLKTHGTLFQETSLLNRSDQSFLGKMRSLNMEQYLVNCLFPWIVRAFLDNARPRIHIAYTYFMMVLHTDKPFSVNRSI